MTHQIENLILEQLKAMRAQLNRIEVDIVDVEGRDHVHEASLAFMMAIVWKVFT